MRQAEDRECLSLEVAGCYPKKSKLKILHYSKYLRGRRCKKIFIYISGSYKESNNNLHVDILY